MSSEPPTSHNQEDPSDGLDPISKNRDEQILEHESRNLFALAVYHICLRTSWIFKTETVIMPAFLDVISGQGWVRGFLPVLNRLGQSVPPILFSENLKRATVKSRALFAASIWMGVPFILLGLLWAWRTDFLVQIFPFVFLFLYAVMFSATGINQLIYGTVQGKLIRPHRRGRLMALSGIIGSILAIVAAWLLLARLMQMPDNNGFIWTFAITGGGFLIAAFTLFIIQEPADAKNETPIVPRLQRFKNAASLFIEDRDFRNVTIVAMLFMTSLLIFPHYQWIGREKVGSDSSSLMTWVVIQNAGVGVFSLLSGMIADRFGYRIVIRGLIFCVACIPLVALWLGFAHPEYGQNVYALVFLLLGLTPVTMKTILNYVLELSDEADHPRYISSLSAYMSLPFFMAPVIGYLFDLSPIAVFCTVSGTIFLGGLWTFRMVEPRDEHPDHHVMMEEIPQ